MNIKLYKLHEFLGKHECNELIVEFEDGPKIMACKCGKCEYVDTKNNVEDLLGHWDTYSQEMWASEEYAHLRAAKIITAYVTMRRKMK
jgi:hypothetical protein